MATKDEQLKADELWKEIKSSEEGLKNHLNYMSQKIAELQGNPYYQLVYGQDASATFGEEDKLYIDNLRLTIINTGLTNAIE
jgi:hypothetical protein